MGVLESLQPQSVFHYFEEICGIPRGSGNEKAISEYLVHFGRERGLFAISDDAYNVIIKKTGANGMENSPPVIIQSHIDMVCEKNSDVEHDFLKDAIKIVTDGEWIRGVGTTLGADNGIGVAYALALLDAQTVTHPPIEVVFTADEETGMGGAEKLDYAMLKGRRLINVDSDEEGKILLSCAGGVKIDIRVPLQFQDSQIPDGIYCQLRIRGLMGGHSGQDIIKERANANKLMARALYILSQKTDYELALVNGGSKDNAIPREAGAVLVMEKEHYQQAASWVQEIEMIYNKEYRAEEKQIQLVLEPMPPGENRKVFTGVVKSKVLSTLMLLPNGIQAMSREIPGLVETSTNMGVVTVNENELIIANALRSSVKTKKEWLISQFHIMADLLNVGIQVKADYPAWEYTPDSPLRKTFKAVYYDMFGKNMQEEAIHAGLECGIFAQKIPGVDIVSFGPDIVGAHSPDEAANIASVARCWEYLLEVLKNLG